MSLNSLNASIYPLTLKWTALEMRASLKRRIIVIMQPFDVLHVTKLRNRFRLCGLSCIINC